MSKENDSDVSKVAGEIYFVYSLLTSEEDERAEILFIHAN